jgi:signal transduction histidine kinase
MHDREALGAEFDDRLEREKLAALQELAYGAGHEINNPLANIAARAQTLLEDEPDPQRRRKLVAIHRQAMRAHEMIADLMLFARPPKMALAQCDLRQLVHQVIEEQRETATSRSIELTCDVGESPLVIRADATQLAIAVAAIVTNALEAVGDEGHVFAMAQPRTEDGARWVDVIVRDDGPGISDTVRQHLFDPFFSGREAGRGLGFGLSKCWRIVAEHGGRVWVHNSPAGGAEFTVALPAA